jgi:hypothetical protein
MGTALTNLSDNEPFCDGRNLEESKKERVAYLSSDLSGTLWAGA